MSRGAGTVLSWGEGGAWREEGAFWCRLANIHRKGGYVGADSMKVGDGGIFVPNRDKGSRSRESQELRQEPSHI